jgi:hypothetical protein
MSLSRELLYSTPGRSLELGFASLAYVPPSIGAMLRINDDPVKPIGGKRMTIKYQLALYLPIVAVLVIATLTSSTSTVWGDITIPAPDYLRSYISGAYYYDYGPPGSDQGVELRVTEVGMEKLSHGTVNQQRWWANLFAKWLMSQPDGWPSQSDRTLQGVAKEIHCHANRWIFSDSSMNIEYNWADVEFAERAGCLTWSP